LNPPAARRRLFLKAQPESREVTMCGSGGIRPHVRRRVLAALAVHVALAAPAAGQDSWRATSTAGAPAARYDHTAVWTGSRMIVWGGFRAVWTGSKVIVWGGMSGDAFVGTGGAYDPATNTWTPLPLAGAPTPRAYHTMVWTGSKAIVWGGGVGTVVGAPPTNTGAIYDPATNSWAATSTVGAPTPRLLHTAVWTGSRMIVWGGSEEGYSPGAGTGGAYDPVTDTWTPLSTSGAPDPPRYGHSAVWTGSRMIAWGGCSDYAWPPTLDTGGIYRPATDSWAPITAAGAPSPRNRLTSVWTGSRMVVWGGLHRPATGNIVALATGGIYDTGIVSAPPFGSFDTPAHGATGVTGAIPVTGWTLDDVAVTRVEIHRNPMPGEPSGPNGKVYVGDATFVPGARPDVAAAYPTYPNADRAGWGYMLLPNMLSGQGNGPFTLYAHDPEGHVTLLGSKAITCTNAAATRPFGTIDTPAQGHFVSGSAYNVFGWALTPQPGTIPTDGSTLQVYVDGVPLGHPTYDLYRSDIATLFPGYANSDGAVGLFVLDTTTLANGLHTIAWSVADDLGRSDGIGSRYFWVQN
jgi:hypothetical protein